jgi:hypothetical protein
MVSNWLKFMGWIETTTLPMVSGHLLLTIRRYPDIGQLWIYPSPQKHQSHQGIGGGSWIRFGTHKYWQRYATRYLMKIAKILIKRRTKIAGDACNIPLPDAGTEGPRCKPAMDLDSLILYIYVRVFVGYLVYNLYWFIMYKIRFPQILKYVKHPPKPWWM